ncbi:VirB3 family type IV secretion system protein [Sphingopyxis fribergensis]
MNEARPFAAAHVEGFEAPLHRALAEPILLGGAPRSIAIVNGTLAAAVGLGLQQWVAGIALWAVGHTLAVFAAKRDPDFAAALARHLRQRGHLSC